MDDDFLALRPSFLPPIAELDVAADLLALAANSLLSRDESKARSYLKQADMPMLRAYTSSIATQTTREIHRVRDVENMPAVVPVLERGPRKPRSSTELEIYRRDGFRCRYCGCRIVAPRAQSIISALLPGAVAWGTADIQLNAAFYTLKGVLDHVVPYANGGTSEPGNMVVACQPCNYGKGNYFLQRIGLSDPRLRAPRVDGWDGLLCVLPLRTQTVRKLAPVVHIERSAE